MDEKIKTETQCRMNGKVNYLLKFMADILSFFYKSHADLSRKEVYVEFQLFIVSVYFLIDILRKTGNKTQTKTICTQ